MLGHFERLVGVLQLFVARRGAPMNKLAVGLAVALASAGAVKTSAAFDEASRLAAAAQVVREVRDRVPQTYWDRARCVAVIPDLKKAAFIFGGEYGKGVMSCRAGDSWSAPVFLQLAKGSWGFQAGVEQVDVVLLIMNDQGVQKLLQNKVTLGADASVAAGPLGAQGQVGTDAALKAEILSYSRAQGLFAGIDLSGGVLRPDEDANAGVYGNGASPRTILASRALSAPIDASAFLAALGSASAAAAAPAEPPASSAATATTPSTSAETADLSDLRARIAEMRQTLDRIIAEGSGESPSSTVGTTGTTTASGRIAVDRERLAQLRQQLDAMAAALDRRR
jgi:lipid-binding SYLF domain-containing protein